MNLGTVKVGDISLLVKEYNGERVVTFKDIDSAHKRVDGTAKRNFNANRWRYTEGKDFYKVCCDTIRRDKIFDISNKARSDVAFITESGYLMIVKSLRDKFAWGVQQTLISKYFNSVVDDVTI